MSQEKQIEEMVKVLEFVCDLQDEDSCISNCDHCRAEALYNAGYRKQIEGEWISVEERLPDPTKNVLVCKTFRGKPYIDIGCVKDAETCCCASDEFIIKPWLHKLTHWMPLPEPPKGE